MQWNTVQFCNWCKVLVGYWIKPGLVILLSGRCVFHSFLGRHPQHYVTRPSQFTPHTTAITLRSVHSIRHPPAILVSVSSTLLLACSVPSLFYTYIYIYYNKLLFLPQLLLVITQFYQNVQLPSTWHATRQTAPHLTSQGYLLE